MAIRIAVDGGPRGQSARSRRSHPVRWRSLSLVCFGLFAVFLVAQSIAGWQVHNDDATDHGEPTISYTRYLTTGSFYEATFENWESEFLQMGAYVLLTVWLVQKGSAESKDPEADEPVDEDPRRHGGDADAPWPVRRGGVWLALYENSLFLAFVLLFLLSMVGHALGGVAEFNAQQVSHGGGEISVLEFVTTSQFWFQSFQNWQSEFLAVFAIVTLTVVLRQRGSAESKPVHASNSETGSS